MTAPEHLDEGNIGYFWPRADASPFDIEKTEPDNGYLKREGRWAIVDVLLEDPIEDWHLGAEVVEFPAAIVGVMAEYSALLLEVQGPWPKHRFGGPRASSRRFRARTVVGDTPVDRLKTMRPLGLDAHFHGIGPWAGMTTAQEARELGKDGRIKSWSVKLGRIPELQRKLTGGRTLVLSGTWRVDGPQDRRLVVAPISVTCRAHRPKDAWSLLEPILHVQNLLCVAFRGFVPSDTGTAELSLHPHPSGRPDSRPWLWNGALMEPVDGAPAPAMDEFPLFRLDHIGGIAGLARWIKLCEQHPRATGPMSFPYRNGASSSAVTVMEVAASFEYWVKHNRPAAWAIGKPFAQAVAGRVGKAFNDWTGNAEAWAKAFWSTYNKLKHEPNFVPDQIEVGDLAVSGRHLLTAVLLDRVAGSKQPSSAIFRHHRLDGLGGRLRDRYA